MPSAPPSPEPPGTAIAELSSVATALEELLHRISRIADDIARSRQESLSSELYEVERSLGTAQRRLTRLLDATRA